MPKTALRQVFPFWCHGAKNSAWDTMFTRISQLFGEQAPTPRIVEIEPQFFVHRVSFIYPISDTNYVELVLIVSETSWFEPCLVFICAPCILYNHIHFFPKAFAFLSHVCGTDPCVVSKRLKPKISGA